jgi:hypothetical protein
MRDIRDSSVSIATSYRLDGWGSIPGWGKDFSLLHSFKIPTKWVPGAPSPWIKGPRRETDLYLMPRTRMVELYLHSSYFFMKWCLIN